MPEHVPSQGNPDGAAAIEFAFQGPSLAFSSGTWIALAGTEFAASVSPVGGEPAIMPMMLFEQADPAHLRTYWEKRDLVARDADDYVRIAAESVGRILPSSAPRTTQARELEAAYRQLWGKRLGSRLE